MSEWIKTDSVLPEKEQQVIGYFPDGDGFGAMQIVSWCRCAKPRAWEDTQGEILDAAPLYWYALPSPPKTSEDKP